MNVLFSPFCTKTNHHYKTSTHACSNVVDLAVAVVIGQAFTDLVNSFVVAFVTPLIGLFGPVNDAGNLAFTINGSTFQYGLFINGLISFIMICLLVYFAIVLPLNAMLQRLYPLTECPECLSDDIPIAAKRCKHCCSPLEPIVIVKKGRSARKIDDTAEDEVVTAVPGSGGGGGAEGGLGERTSMVPSEDFYDPEEDVVLTYQYQQPQPQMQQQ